MVFGTVSGYSYVYPFIFDAVENTSAAIFFTGAGLLSLEILNNLLLSKLFKFAYRKFDHWRKSVVIFVVTAAMFGASFHIATMGLASRQSAKIDQTEVLNENRNIEIDGVKDKYSELIANIKGAVLEIRQNPRGKGSKLNTAQQNAILAYNGQILHLQNNEQKEIAALEIKHKYELKENGVEVESIARKFYAIMAVSMLLQFVSNAFLMFAWGQIRNDLNKDSVVNDVVTTMQVDARELFLMAIKQEGTAFKNAMQKQSIWQSSNALNAPQTQLNASNETETINASNAPETLTTQSVVPETQSEVQAFETVQNASKTVGFVIPNAAKVESVSKKTVAETETIARKCLHCGTEFMPKRKDNWFCGAKCRMTYHNFKLKK